MGLAPGNLRKALRDEARMVLGQLFSVSKSTSNTVTVYDVDRQSVIYMTGPSSNVFIGCLLRFTSGPMAGLYFLIVNVYSGITTPLELVLDGDFPNTVEPGTTFEVFSVPPAYNGQSNVSSFNTSFAFPANSGLFEFISTPIAVGQVFSTRGNRYMLQIDWNTPCLVSVLIQNATAFAPNGSVETLTDLAFFALPAANPSRGNSSKSLTLSGLFTGPSNPVSFNGVSSGVQSNITVTLLGSSGSTQTSVDLSVFSL